MKDIMTVLKKFLGSLVAAAGLSLFASFPAASPLFAGKLTLTWTPPTTNTDGSPISYWTGSHKVYIGTSSGVYTTVIDLPNFCVSQPCSYQVEGLNVDTLYYFVMTALNSMYSESSYSNQVAKSWTRPATPQGFRGRAASDSKIILDWNKVVSGGESGNTVATQPLQLQIDPAGMQVEGYLIYRDGKHVATTNGTSFSDSGLEPETDYIYAVKAFTREETISDATDPLILTTRSGPAGSPSLPAVSFSDLYNAASQDQSTAAPAPAQELTDVPASRNSQKGRKTVLTVPVTAPLNFSKTPALIIPAAPGSGIGGK